MHHYHWLHGHLQCFGIHPNIEVITIPMWWRKEIKAYRTVKTGETTHMNPVFVSEYYPIVNCMYMLRTGTWTFDEIMHIHFRAFLKEYVLIIDNLSDIQSKWTKFCPTSCDIPVAPPTLTLNPLNPYKNHWIRRDNSGFGIGLEICQWPVGFICLVLVF